MVSKKIVVTVLAITLCVISLGYKRTEFQHSFFGTSKTQRCQNTPPDDACFKRVEYRGLPFAAIETTYDSKDINDSNRTKLYAANGAFGGGIGIISNLAVYYAFVWILFSVFEHLKSRTS